MTGRRTSLSSGHVAAAPCANGNDMRRRDLQVSRRGSEVEVVLAHRQRQVLPSADKRDSHRVEGVQWVASALLRGSVGCVAHGPSARFHADG